MTSPFFLASRKDVASTMVGIFVAIAESIGDPAATILVGKMFKELQRLISGHTSPQTFINDVTLFSVGLVIVAGYTFIMNWIGYVVWVGVGYSQGHAARLRLYRGVVMRPAAWYDCQAQVSGLAMTYFKDIQDVEMAAGITAYEMLAMTAGFCIQIGVAFYYSWAVTLICLAGVPVLVLVGSLFSPQITQRVLFTKSLLDEISDQITWVLGALQTVKIFQRERYEWTRLHRYLLRYQQASVRYWLLFKLQEGIFRTIVLMIFVQGFYFGSYMVKHHGLDAGNVITVFFSCLAASGLLQQLVGHLIEWNRGNASAERLAHLLEFEKGEDALFSSIGLMPGNGGLVAAKLETLGWAVDGTVVSESKTLQTDECTVAVPLERVNSLDSGLSLSTASSFDSRVAQRFDKTKGHIVLSDVVFSYPARQEIVLAGLSMEFRPGSLTFVLGTSGSGKSTIAALLSKQYSWQAGEVAIDGHSVDLLSKEWIERNVYVAEQMPKIFDVSLLDNIKIGSRSPHSVTNEKVEQLCEVACADFVWALPSKLQTSGRFPLSGGQAQRISLCRALMNDATVMIFDEATSALDPELQTEVMKRLTAYRSQKTTIVITHDPTLVPSDFPVYVVTDGTAKKFSSIASATKHWTGSPLRSTGISKEVDLESHKRVKRNSVTAPNSLPGIPLRRNELLKTSVSLFSSIPNKNLYTVGLILATVHAVINPIFSFVFSKLLMGIIDPQSSRVTLWAMLVLMCAILDGIVTFSSSVLNVCGQKWLSTIRERLFDQLLNYKDTSLLQRESTQLSKLLISDAERCVEILTLYWPGLLNMLVLGFVGIIWSMVTGWELTLVSISLIPAFFVINQLYKRLATRWTAKRESLRGDVVRLLTDLMSPAGFRTLKLQHLERFFQQIYDSRESKLQALTWRMAVETGLAYGALKCFPYAIESLVLWYGMYLTAHGSYSPQITMTVFSLIMFTIVTIDQLTSSIGGVGTGFEASERLIRALSETRSFSTAKRAGSHRQSLALARGAITWHSIKFRQVEVMQATGETILFPFSAEFSEGETIAIVGNSGVGKSTIARMLLKLQRPSRGEIVVDHQWDLESLCDFDVRQSVALVGQLPLDFSEGTIEENLLYALDSNDICGPSRMVDVCNLCGVHDFVSRLQDGYNTRMKNGVLSGGQAQRLGIARALLRRPKVLILDECTSALDHQSKNTILSLIEALKNMREMIILIITHQMDVASVADRTIEIAAF